jgi:hypothetical protein
MMSFIRSTLVVGATFGAISPGAALAQTTAPSPSTLSTIDDVSCWTEDQRNRAKAE